MRGATESPSDVSWRLSVLEGRLALCRLDAGKEVPTWATAGTPFSVTRTPEESGPKPRPEKLLREPGLRSYLEGWGREDDFAVVALDADGGGRIGAAWFRLFSASQPGYGFVDEKTPELAVAVAGEWRGRGVGGALLAALKEAAKTNGFHALNLSVQKTNPAAGLYRRVGFVEIRDDGDDWTMKAELTGPESPSDARSAQRTEER